MIRRFSLILIPTLLTLFALEIFFVSYLPDANLRGSGSRFSSNTSSVDVFLGSNFRMTDARSLQKSESIPRTS